MDRPQRLKTPKPSGLVVSQAYKPVRLNYRALGENTTAGVLTLLVPLLVCYTLSGSVPVLPPRQASSTATRSWRHTNPQPAVLNPRAVLETHEPRQSVAASVVAAGVATWVIRVWALASEVVTTWISASRWPLASSTVQLGCEPFSHQA